MVLPQKTFIFGTMNASMETPIKIVVGSTSAHKLDAVRRACERTELHASVSGVKADSGQHEQPVGFNATYGGALARARAARVQSAESIAIGIESGIFRFGGDNPITLDIAVVVALTPDGREIISTSEGVQFPEQYVAMAEARGFATTTVGSVIAEALGGDPTNPHATHTHGKITRTELLVDALSVALRQCA